MLLGTADRRGGLGLDGRQAHWSLSRPHGWRTEHTLCSGSPSPVEGAGASSPTASGPDNLSGGRVQEPEMAQSRLAQQEPWGLWASGLSGSSRGQKQEVRLNRGPWMQGCLQNPHTSGGCTRLPSQRTEAAIPPGKEQKVLLHRNSRKRLARAACIWHPALWYWGTAWHLTPMPLPKAKPAHGGPTPHTGSMPAAGHLPTPVRPPMYTGREKASK